MSVPPRVSALALIALFVGVAYWIPNHLYQRLPRLEDEIAELWQARVYAAGRLIQPAPPAAEAFSVPFVIDRDGWRFSKYPPGHAALLALGVLMGEPWIINPLLFALAALYRLSYELYGSWTALLALALAATSPMLIMLSASLMPHAAGLLTATLGLWGFLRLPRAPTPRLAALTGLAFGLTVLIRPFTTLCLAVPLLVIALAQLKSNPRRALQRYWPLVAVFALISTLLPVHNYLVSGQPVFSLYTLWWTYDHPGLGPAVGPHGYYLTDLLQNSGLGLWSLNLDLLGWMFLSLVPLGLGLALRPRPPLDLHLAAYPAALFLGYLLFFHQSRLYGPRYYSEAAAPLCLLSARGLQKIGLLFRGEAARRSVLTLILPGAVVILVASNLLFYLPLRFKLLQNLYDGALNWDAVWTAQANGVHQAIVFVFADNWPGAAAGLLTNSPELRDDVLFARYTGPEAFKAARTAYPERALYFWRDDTLAPASLPPPEWVPRCPTVCPPQ